MGSEETYDPRFWQDGIAGICNIVTFDGEDVRGVTFVADGSVRRRVIADQNKWVRSALQLNAKQAGVTEAQFCKWTLDSCESYEIWDSDCGEKWSFMEGGPADNNVTYCHGCGKPVAAIGAEGQPDPQEGR